MKKFKVWMVVVILLCGSSSVQAQNVDYETKHDIAVSYGGAPITIWAKIGQAIGDALVGKATSHTKYENTSWFGSLSAEYFYHLDPAFSIGGIACFSQDNDDFLKDNVKAGDRTTRFITVMPALKWDYLRRNYFGMYMKLGVGYTFFNCKETYHDTETNSDKKYNNNDGLFNCQISLLGVEAGPKHIRGFFELGFGEQGIALLGLRCKF